MQKYIYYFGADSSERRGKTESKKESKRESKKESLTENSPSRDILGGKGKNLAEMANMGIPVPPGIIISTQACREFIKAGNFPEGLLQELDQGVKRLEKSLGRNLGDSKRPLLVSVRSGAPISMPGMMDTILNLGLNDKTLEGLTQNKDNERFALDSYRRFIQMFSNVVLNIGHEKFETILENYRDRYKVRQDFELKPNALRAIIEEFLHIIEQESGNPFPQDTTKQLQGAIKAVFSSWNNERAIFYRKLNNIPDALGTAVTIQSMVFGNMGDKSGTGVAFTRSPANGEKRLYGEYLFNAQGEDVVAGIRTPQPISNLKKMMPDIYEQFHQIQQRLEDHFGDMQDMEFTIEQGKLFLLQTRNGKRTAIAALQIAVDLVSEGKIDKNSALKHIDPNTIPSLLAPLFEDEPKKRAIEEGHLLTTGLSAGPGAAAGKIAFDSQTAMRWSANGERVILARQETSPEDIIGMQHSRGILTTRGGITSHAAVIARGMNKPCIVGCSELHIDYSHNTMKLQKKAATIEIKEGDEISIDGSSGEVIRGRLPTTASEIDQTLKSKLQKKKGIAANFIKLMNWADQKRKLSIRANADSFEDAVIARRYGAEGIGLCRTEHMFFESHRTIIMRQMILSESKEERKNALNKLLEYQREDFEKIFQVMEGLPVTIRLLDPPLHEFLPQKQEQYVELSRHINLSADEIKHRSIEMKEENPMLGHRGCRLGITFPEITAMQARAIIEAALILIRAGKNVEPEIMIPLVGHPKEFQIQKELIEKTANDVMEKENLKINYTIGTMIEVPRAAIQADKIAQDAHFFSFGTNDLTQMTLAFSRDDSGIFLSNYIDLGIYDSNPFQKIDIDGVGEMIKMAIERGRRKNQSMKLGVCGEHGGDPDSIRFFHDIGIDYVSCSPFRVPVARLAAAQANLD